ncbi:hypothetical protein QAD02_017517 [Eretmocerus hayati]|uniref:Uncharacterized protein n=1 Tax=Eretmocerus hayati TaxID=131215 RepID=A0ACC2PE52_9HYME|nr:hypothetical protein QAD02_017517 [Eretmocerus hayati]
MAPKRSLKTDDSDDLGTKKASKKQKNATSTASTSSKASKAKTKKVDGKQADVKPEGRKKKTSSPAVPSIDREKQLALNKQLFDEVKRNIQHKCDLDVVKKLIANGADVNAKNKEGTPVLIEALGEPRDIIQLLLDAGANPNCKRADDVTFIQLAISWNIGWDGVELLEMIFDAGYTMNYEEDGEKVCPAIWGAISSAQENIIDFVLDKGADVTVLDDEGKSVLAHLVQLSTDDVCMYDWDLDRFKSKYLKILKSHGAKFTKADKKENLHKTSTWKTSRPCMGWRRPFATARFITMPPKRNLKAAAAANNSAELDVAGPSSKKAKLPAKSVSKSKSTLTSKATTKKAQNSKQSSKSGNKPGGDEKPLIKAKATLPRPTKTIDPEQQKALNEQLFAVVKAGSLEMIKQLAKEGADLDAKDEKGNPLLFKALRYRDEVLELLLELGANPNCINAEGHTLLLEAVINSLGCESTGTLRTLLKGGADVNFVNKEEDQCPALWTMLTNGVEKQVDLFLEYGADVTTCDEDGNSILSFLADLDTDQVPMKDWELERYIVKYTRVFKSLGAKLSQADIDQEGHNSPLQKYLECGEEKEARAFIKEYKKGYRGVELPLHVAAHNPRSKCLRFLLKTGLFDVNQKDSWGQTPLFNAAYCENAANTRLLLEHGADPNVTNSRGDTPWDLAKDDKHYEHIDLLRSYGAKRPKRDSDDSDNDSDDSDYRRPGDCVIA